MPLIALAGLFFGFVPTIIFVALTAVFRFWQCDFAAPVGMAVMLAAGNKKYEIGFRLRHRDGRGVSVISRGFVSSVKRSGP